jgi:hypothetical protein
VQLALGKEPPNFLNTVLASPVLLFLSQQPLLLTQQPLQLPRVLLYTHEMQD